MMVPPATFVVRQPWRPSVNSTPGIGINFQVAVIANGFFNVQAFIFFGFHGVTPARPPGSERNLERAWFIVLRIVCSFPPFKAGTNMQLTVFAPHFCRYRATATSTKVRVFMFLFHRPGSERPCLTILTLAFVSMLNLATPHTFSAWDCIVWSIIDVIPFGLLCINSTSPIAVVASKYMTFFWFHIPWLRAAGSLRLRFKIFIFRVVAFPALSNDFPVFACDASTIVIFRQIYVAFVASRLR